MKIRRRHTLMVKDGAFIYKIDYLRTFQESLYLEGHPNLITGSRVTAILLNGWILHIGGASAVEGLLSTGPTLSSFHSKLLQLFSQHAMHKRGSPCCGSFE